MWDGYFSLDGQEIINVSRTEAYAAEAQARWFKPLFENDDLAAMLGHTDYVSPVIDSAPWYDPLVAASEDFWGLYPLDISGIEDSSRSATVIESTIDGAIPGRIRHGSKTAVFNAILLGRNEKAVAYGIRWLRRALLGDFCDDTTVADYGLGHEAIFLAHRPEIDVTESPTQTMAGLVRTVRRFSVNVGPTITAKRTMDTCEGEMWMVTFTATIGDPAIYGAPIPILQGWLDGTAPTSETPNLQSDSSLELQSTTNWVAGSGGVRSFVTTDEAPQGAVVGQLDSPAAGNPYVQSAADALIPIAPADIGQYLTMYAQMRWVGANTPNPLTRMNVLFLDAAFATVAGGSFIGTPFAPDTDFQRVQNNDNVIPAGSVWARVRFIINTSVIGDAIQFDEVFATIGANIVNAGPHPTWVPHEDEVFINPDPWAPDAVAGTFDNDATVFTEVECGDDTWEPIYDPLCPPLVAPPTPPSVPLGCLDLPLEFDRRTVVIPAANVPLWDQVAPVVSLYAPDIMRNVRVRFYTDPSGDLDPAADPCTFNADLVVSYIPAEATLRIDAAAREVWVETVAGQTRRADRLVTTSESKPIDWPLLSCGHQQIMTLDTEVGAPAPAVDLTFTPRVV